jgi:hypothetical protein
LEKGYPLCLKNLNPTPLRMICGKSGFKIGSVPFWRRRFVNDPTLFLHFYDYLPFEEDLALNLKKLEVPSSKNNLYKV